MMKMNQQFDIKALNEMAQNYQIETDKMDMMEDMTEDVSGDQCGCWLSHLCDIPADYWRYARG
jgi:hypothetical protein